MPRQRTFKINLDRLNALMVKRGWVRTDLAAAAALSSRTIDSIMAGEGVLMYTVKRLAKALNEPIPGLINGSLAQEENPHPEKQERIVTVQIALNIPFDALNEAGQLGRFIDLVATFLGMSEHGIRVAGIKEGSVFLYLEMTEPDARRMLDGPHLEWKTKLKEALTSLKKLMPVIVDDEDNITRLTAPIDEMLFLLANLTSMFLLQGPMGPDFLLDPSEIRPSHERPSPPSRVRERNNSE